MTDAPASLFNRIGSEAVASSPAIGAGEGFARALRGAAGRNAAQELPAFERDRRDRGTGLSGVPDATQLAVTELSTAGPLKATVAEAVNEQVAPKDPSAEATRSTPRGESAQPRASASASGDAQGRPPAPVQSEAAAPAAPDQRSGSSRRASASESPVPAMPPSRGPVPVPSGGNAGAASAAPGAPATAGKVDAVRSSAGREGGPARGAPGPTAERASPPGLRRGLDVSRSEQPDAQGRAEKFAAQVGRGLAAAIRQNGGTVTLRLSPQALGDLKIRMQLQHGRVEARFEVGSDKARSLLDRTIGHLRSALEAQGLEVDRLAVHTVERPERAGHGEAAQSGPPFAKEGFDSAGGEPGGHGWHGAERHEPGVWGPAREFAGGPAEPEVESWPEKAWSAAGEDVGGAPLLMIRLDLVA